MSAVLAPRPSAEQDGTQLRLHAVDQRPGKMRRLPFMVVLLIFLGVGMAGVLLLATSLQGQTNELNQLQRQAASLRYQQAALLSQVEDARSSQHLASRAWELGMRPNPHPVIIQLPDGAVLGEAKPAPGNAFPGMAPRPTSTPMPQPSAGVDPEAAESSAAAQASISAEPQPGQSVAPAADPNAQPAQPATDANAVGQQPPAEQAAVQPAADDQTQAAAPQAGAAPAGQGGR